MANDYPDGDFLPGFGVPSGDRDYGRDRDRNDWRGDGREDPRRGPGRDRYGDDERYPGGRQVREDRYADDRYGDDRYGDDRYGDDGRGPAVAAAPGRTTGVAAVSGTPGTGTALDAGQAAMGGPVMMVTTARHGGGAAGIRGSPRGSRCWSSWSS